MRLGMRLLGDNYNSVVEEIRERRRTADPELSDDVEVLNFLLATVGGGVATFQLAVDLRKMRGELENHTLQTPMSSDERTAKYPGFAACYRKSLFESLPPIYRFIRRLNTMAIEGVRPGPDGGVGNR